METFKQIVIFGAVTLCFLATFTDSVALRPQPERTNLHTILKRLDGILDNLIEDNRRSRSEDTDGSVSFVTSKRNEDGSVPYKRNEDGSIPYKRNEDGSIPYKRNEDGSIPYKRNEDGSIPYKRNEDGSIPYKRRESLTTPDDVSLHDVLTYLLALEEQNQGTIHQKRDHGV